MINIRPFWHFFLDCFICRFCFSMQIYTSLSPAFWCFTPPQTPPSLPLLILIKGLSQQVLSIEPDKWHCITCLIMPRQSGHLSIQYTPTLHPPSVLLPHLMTVNCYHVCLRIAFKISLSQCSWTWKWPLHCNCPVLENNDQGKKKQQHLHEISVFMLILLWHISRGD